MSQSELLKTVVDLLNRGGIAHMLTGSLVSSLQGEPRSTHDIDFVVSMHPQNIREFLAAFPAPRYYLSEDAVRQALDERGMFNLVDTETDQKVDFWVLPDEPFDRSCFARRETKQVLGVPIPVSRPEDTILAKLRWAEISGGSEKQFTDALRVYEIQYGILDLDYLRQWAQQLGLQDLWSALQDKAEPLE